MTKFGEGTNILVRYNEEFVKSGVSFSVFFSQKWRDREILFDVTRNSLKTMFVKTRVHCTVIWRVFMWKRKEKEKQTLCQSHLHMNNSACILQFRQFFLSISFHFLSLKENNAITVVRCIPECENSFSLEFQLPSR